MEQTTTSRPTAPRSPPGRWPLLGHLPAVAANPLAMLERWHAQLGDLYRLEMPLAPLWMVNRPEEIERVLTARGAFRKDRDLRKAKPLFGEGLLTSDGDFWMRQRRLAQPAFHRERVEGYAARMVELAQELAGRCERGAVRDVHRDMMALTLQIACETLFGDAQVDAGAVSSGLEIVLQRFEGVNSLLPPWLPVGFPARFRRGLAQLDGVVYEVIHRRRANDAQTADLLSLFLHAQDEDGARMNDRQLRDEVLTMLLAGHETTANALAWTWHLLAANPAAERALHDEVRALPGPPGPADVPKLPYANAVIQESMRLYPPAWILGREALVDFELAGHLVPKGHEIAVSQWVVHRDERYYPRPLEFRPERWLDGSTKRNPAYAYFPFGGGQRMCIGKGFALMEAVLILGTLARELRFEGAGALVRPHASITLRPKGGLPMRVARA